MRILQLRKRLLPLGQAAWLLRQSFAWIEQGYGIRKSCRIMPDHGGNAFILFGPKKSLEM
jgi:hypothetical protein